LATEAGNFLFGEEAQQPQAGIVAGTGDFRLM